MCKTRPKCKQIIKVLSGKELWINSFFLFSFFFKLCFKMNSDLLSDCSWVVHVHTKESTADKLTQQQNIQVNKPIPLFLHGFLCILYIFSI